MMFTSAKEAPHKHDKVSSQKKNQVAPLNDMHETCVKHVLCKDDDLLLNTF